jgi:hypothetical protein
MFELLDKTLAELMARAPFTALGAASTSFETPEKTFIPNDELVNLFLYETRENRELRDSVPIIEQRNGLSVRRNPPLRVDCCYLVTTWSMESGADKVAAEHALLAQAFNWLSRFPVIPQWALTAGGLTGQAFAPPTLVAQMDPVKSVGEFWSALGIAPRPFFNLMVTITMDLDLSLEEFPVTTMLTNYYAGDPARGDRRALIAGTVRDRNATAVRDAWVRLEPAGFTTVTDSAGHFVFDNVAPGAGMTLRARAPGFTEATLPNAQIPSLDIPSVDGHYDLTFS